MSDTPSLEQFITWYMNAPFQFAMSPVLNEFNDFGKFFSIVIYRKDQFQVELFYGLPEAKEAEAHTHPDVDSYEMHVTGKMNFHCNGVVYPDTAITEETAALSVPLAVRSFQKVFSNDIHGANPEGGIAFLSFQHWKNDVKPSSVGHNWSDKAKIQRDMNTDIKIREIERSVQS
jgi:hypothetical protein